MTATLDSPIRTPGPVHGPADKPGRRDLLIPRGYQPPVTDIAGHTAAAQALAATRDSCGFRSVDVARAIVELGGFTIDDRAYLLGVAQYVLETWTSRDRGRVADAFGTAAKLLR